MLRPDKAEDLLVEGFLGIEVPTREDMKDIEPSSRLYTAKDAVFMTASLVCKADTGHPELTDVAFVLTRGMLITIRYEEPKAFDLFTAAMHRIPGGCAHGNDSGDTPLRNHHRSHRGNPRDRRCPDRRFVVAGFRRSAASASAVRRIISKPS